MAEGWRQHKVAEKFGLRKVKAAKPENIATDLRQLMARLGDDPHHCIDYELYVRVGGEKYSVRGLRASIIVCMRAGKALILELP